MAKLTDKQNKLINALSIVQRDAEDRKKRAEGYIENPLDWHHEGHIESFKNEVEQASIVHYWCFIRQMQIDPD